jgi:glycine hydroxymethyltransferase
MQGLTNEPIIETVARTLPDDYLDAPLAEVDPEISRVIGGELGRQRDTLEMIASENFVPQAVLEAVGSVLTNKYAEGYPGRRYYGGCEWVDEAERLAIDRAKAVFGGDHVNVQPHAGAQANNAAYMALLEPGDTILGMALDHGGHLTHGMKINLSGALYNAVPYHVRREDGLVDMEEVERLAREHRPKLIAIIICREEHAKRIDKAVFPGPLMHAVAAKAVALRIAGTGRFRERQRRTVANAKALAEELGAGGLRVLTGGTDVHLVLVDLNSVGLDGRAGEDRLGAVGITVNRNAIPFDPRPPMNPSGLRIGTPALTTRGMVEEDLREIGRIIVAALGEGFDAGREELLKRSRTLAGRYPLYPPLAAV